MIPTVPVNVLGQLQLKSFHSSLQIVPLPIVLPLYILLNCRGALLCAHVFAVHTLYPLFECLRVLHSLYHVVKVRVEAFNDGLGLGLGFALAQDFLFQGGLLAAQLSHVEVQIG